MKLGDRMDAVMALNLKAPVKAVLFVLARRANDKTGKCWPSLKRLSADSGNGRSTTSRALRDLQRLGLVQVTTHPRKASDYTVNLGAFMVALSNLMVPILDARGTDPGHGTRKRTLRTKPRSQKTTKSQFPKCVTCGKWPTIDGESKLCLKCWRVVNPKRKVKA